MIKVYQLEYLSPVTEINSFSLFGAFCWGYRFIKGEEALLKFIDGFKNEPSFLFSSPLPLAGSEILFPKPALKMKLEENIPLKEKLKRKPYKKARYVTLNVLKDIITGDTKYQNDIMTKYKVDNGVIYKEGENINFNLKNKSFLFTRNLINRQKNISENLFLEVSRLIDREVFFVRFISKEFLKDFEQIIDVIQDLGLGGNKNVGWGKVKIKERTDINLDLNFDNRKYSFITLSSVIPTSNIDFNKSFYDVYMFKSFTEGTFQHSLTKEKVAFLKEGSIIKTLDKTRFAGQLKQVHSSSKIYQYGLEFPVYLEWCYE